jgi:hypothetical protein
LRIEVFENGELVEENLLMRGVHELILEASDADGSCRWLVINPNKDTSITHVQVDNEEFKIESAAGEHAFLLSQALMERKPPNNRRLKSLAEELKRNGALIDEIKVRSRFVSAVMLADSGAIDDCIIMCEMCGLGISSMCVPCIICRLAEQPATPTQ